ncbi:hypothetical protein DTO217A2_1912 [Paecilomyces variotii]|nr:hypothetical protein DTO217A2_1912 [Paecilomyces variotii]KAJ9352102.1 hypothetical protein DTO027B9_6034 [Paecilomyces variotii]KAJ9373176.1 hypothetical protein DTO282E5_2243 [Paecilomyces variotii]KAJ9396167.1 hypothetical protein DTO282F9_6871 [Paecilomyces variotii]
MTDTYSSSSYFYSSATNTSDGSSTTGHRYTTSSHTDPNGNTIVRTAHQDLGAPAIIEERRYDRTGQQLLLDTGTGVAGGTRRIEDLGSYDATGATMSDPGTTYGTDNVGTAADATAGTAYGSDTVGPSTNEYDQHLDYDTDGHRRHHREKQDSEGRWYHRDVDREKSDPSSGHVHREYSNPNTGRSSHTDYEF